MPFQAFYLTFRIFELIIYVKISQIFIIYRQEPTLIVRLIIGFIIPEDDLHPDSEVINGNEL